MNAWIRRRTTPLSLIALLSADAVSAGAQVPSWTVSAQPLTVIGVAIGDPNHELVGVLGAFRQSDGHLVAAASDPLQLRRYDSRGVFVSLVGRRGSGPGEYRGRVSLYPGHADSILIFDDRTSRWTSYSPDGTVVRSWVSTPEERRRLVPVAWRRTVIHPGERPVPVCYRTLIAAMPPPHDTAYREAFPDGRDRAWFRDEGSPEWTVRSLTGRVLGRVALPPGFELLQIGDGFVTGRRRDNEGLERIEVIRVAMPPHAPPPPCASRPDSFPPDTVTTSRTLNIDLRNLESAGDAYHADYNHYAMTLDSVRKASGFTLSVGTEVHLMPAHDGVGWDAVARSKATPRFCRILIGEIAQIWLYRFAYCGP